MDSDRPSQPWRSGDELEAVRLEQMRHNAESARLTAASKNVRLYGSAQGNTAIAVDEPEIPRSDFVGYFRLTFAAYDTAPNLRWLYNITQVESTGVGGYTNWTDVSGGIVSTARNLNEVGNADVSFTSPDGYVLNASGLIEGTGKTISHVPLVNRPHRVYLTNGGYWFDAPNPLTGDCEAP